MKFLKILPDNYPIPPKDYKNTSKPLSCPICEARFPVKYQIQCKTEDGKPVFLYLTKEQLNQIEQTNK